MISYDIGQKICDMHYGQPSKDYEDNPIKVIHLIEIELDNAEQLVRAMLHSAGSEKHQDLNNPYRVDNKYAMVVGMDYMNNRHQAIYSYDGRTFGTFEFENLETGE